MYDQIGCGLSAVDVPTTCFTKDFWLDELENLIQYLKLDNYHILGQSWGGMMVIAYLCDREIKSVKSVILSSTLSSAKMLEEEQYWRISYMDKKDREAIYQARREGNYTDKNYIVAFDKFMEKYCSSKAGPNSTEYLIREKIGGKLAYLTGWGENEFTPQGSLSDFKYTDKLCQIKTKTLIISGQMNLSSPYIGKILNDKIKNSTWHLFQYSRQFYRPKRRILWSLRKIFKKFILKSFKIKLFNQW